MFMLTSWFIERSAMRGSRDKSALQRNRPSLTCSLKGFGHICVHLRSSAVPKLWSVPVAAAPRCVHPWFPFFGTSHRVPLSRLLLTAPGDFLRHLGELPRETEDSVRRSPGRAKQRALFGGARSGQCAVGDGQERAGVGADFVADLAERLAASFADNLGGAGSLLEPAALVFGREQCLVLLLQPAVHLQVGHHQLAER